MPWRRELKPKPSYTGGSTRRFAASPPPPPPEWPTEAGSRQERRRTKRIACSPLSTVAKGKGNGNRKHCFAKTLTCSHFVPYGGSIMARHCQLISPDHGLLSTDHIRTISMLSTTTIHPDHVIGSTHNKQCSKTLEQYAWLMGSMLCNLLVTKPCFIWHVDPQTS